MTSFFNVNTFVGALYLLFGLLVVFVLIPVGVDEPGNVEFAVLAPSYWPRVICIVISLLGFSILFREWRKSRRVTRADSGPEFPRGQRWWRVGVVMVLLLLLHAVLEYLGFVLAGAGALVLLMLLAGERRPVHLISISVAVPLAIYFFFTKAASIPIPAGVLEQFLV